MPGSADHTAGFGGTAPGAPGSSWAFGPAASPVSSPASPPGSSPASPDPFGANDPSGAFGGPGGRAHPYAAPGPSGMPGTGGAPDMLSAPPPSDAPGDLFRSARSPRPGDPYGSPSPFAAGAPGAGGPADPFGGPGMFGAPGAAQARGPQGAPPEGGSRSFRPSGTPGSFGAAGPAPGDRPGTDGPSDAEPSWDTSDVVLPPTRSRRRPVLLSVGMVVLLAAAGGGIYLGTQRGGDPSPTAASASPTASPTVGPRRPPGKYGFAVSRKYDPSQLTVKELFPRTKVVNGGRTYIMRVSRKDKVCKNAVEGEKLQKALKAAKCTHIVRASFEDSTGKIIGTVGVANLSTSAGARKVASAGAAKERKDYVKPLQGKSGATKFLGTGEALAGAWTHGHYAVLLWFQFKDGHKPNAADAKRLNRAASDITDKTVFPALDTRALTGRRG